MIIFKAVPPSFAGLIATDQPVLPIGAVMGVRVVVTRGVAARNPSTIDAYPQVHPIRAYLYAVLAHVSLWGDGGRFGWDVGAIAHDLTLGQQGPSVARAPIIHVM